MKLEAYFDFLASDDIRIKGTRIGIESVLYEYIHREQPAESIASRFPTLTLEQVYATILFYLHNKEKISKYISEWLDYGKRMRAEQEKNPSPVVLKLRAIKEKRRKELTAQ